MTQQLITESDRLNSAQENQSETTAA